MSMPLKTHVSCPQCGKEIEFTMWQTINTNIPSAIPDIISGKLFAVECAYCGFQTSVNYPILVNDMNHNIMVHYTFPDKKDEVEKSVKMIQNIGGRVRIVLSQASLREKIAIFDAGFDDRVIEMMKLLVAAAISDQVADGKIEDMFYVPGENPHFDVIYDSGTGTVPIPEGFYENVKQEFFSAPGFANDREVYIDHNWARRILAVDENG